MSVDERRDALRAVTRICATAGRLVRELLDGPLTPEHAVVLSEALVEAGRKLERYGQHRQDESHGGDEHGAAKA